MHHNPDVNTASRQIPAERIVTILLLNSIRFTTIRRHKKLVYTRLLVNVAAVLLVSVAILLTVACIEVGLLDAELHLREAFVIEMTVACRLTQAAVVGGIEVCFRA